MTKTSSTDKVISAVASGVDIVNTLAILANVVASVAREINRFRSELGVSDEEWGNAKQKNQTTVADFVAQHGGTLPLPIPTPTPLPEPEPTPEPTPDPEPPAVRFEYFKALTAFEFEASRSLLVPGDKVHSTKDEMTFLVAGGPVGVPFDRKVFIYRYTIGA